MDKQDGPPRPSSMTPGVSTSPPAALSANISFQPPTPISPSVHNDHPSDGNAVAGPSTQSGSGPVPIPPPPNPRRHRSGVLMSRVRANSSGTNFRAGVNAMGSKSFGDLGMSTMHPDGDGEVEDEVEEMTPPWGKRETKRVVSDGVQRGSEEDDSMWDNSARFYHHLHSRPPSRAASRQASPTLSPVSPARGVSPATSASASPIYVRRSLTLPQNGQTVSLSPNHIFLQQHLPPTFPAEPVDDHHPTRVILTPTTQEWRELREKRRQEGEELDSAEDTSSGSDESRRSSIHDGTGKSALFGNDPAFSQMPPLKATMSADFLPVEATHTPDPGSPVLFSAEDEKSVPLFQPVIIAPSPIAPDTNVVPVAPDTPTHNGLVRAAPPDIVDSSSEVDEDQPVFARDESLAPARFNSIGRRESLRAIRPTAPRAKTKRELEREKLFKELDEELETEPEKPTLAARGSVQEIGMGWGLNTRPGSADQVASPDQPAERSLASEPTDVFDKHFERTHAVQASKAQEVIPAETKTNKETSRGLGHHSHKPHPAHLSPTQPMKPSPLHSSSPVNAPSGLPTPESPYDAPPILDIPPVASPAPATPAIASPQSHTANLDTIRSYARALANPHPHHARAKSGVASASPPSSPRLPKSRRRDTNRVSLVAGRVVQPFAIPPSTSLPPTDRPDLKTRQSTTSLQSFSPFRSPALGPSKTNGAVPPSFNRLDSTISLAPSTGAPSECATPTSETAGGLGGRGIDDYVILKEAGKGAYGLVMRAKVKGPKGDPVGEEVIIKYIIKARILADCWKKHRELGPIPVEIHVMDQLRHLLYNPPLQPNPWDPMRKRTESTASSDLNNGHVKRDSLESLANTPDSPRSESSAGGGLFSPTQKYIASEIRHSPERGHPNICKLLDFFEDREFYYLVMPRFGTGVDLFDRVESEPEGLDPFETRSLLGQLTDAVRFLHSNGIIHRDIKDENVILDGQGRCQLIDFGSAAHWRPGKRWDTFSGTLHYASPEILRGGMYGGKEQDVWALGVVGYVLLVGETPFSDLPDEVLAGLTPDSSAEAALTARCGGEHVDEGKEADGGGSLADAADFVRRCLEMETPERPSADLLCQHRYLRGEGGWVGKKGWVAKGWK